MDEPVFVVVDGVQPPSKIPGTFTLTIDNWDDYHFKTSYVLHFATADEVVEIGAVKVAKQGMEPKDPHTDLPNRFTALGDQYFSLGQDREYYAALEKLPNEIGHAALKTLRDVAQDPLIYERAQSEAVFETSLLRHVPELTVTNQFRRIISGKAQLTHYEFQYSMVPDTPIAPTLRLDFSVQPDRLCFVNFFPAKRAPKIQPGEHGFQPCELRVRYGERAYPCRAADGKLSAALTFVVTTSLDGPQSGLSAFRSPPAGAGSEFRGDRGRTGIGRLMRSRSGRRDCFGAGWFQLRRGRFRIVGRARRC